MAMVILVPLPWLLKMLHLPPIICARSFIPMSPKVPFLPDACGSKPFRRR